MATLIGQIRNDYSSIVTAIAIDRSAAAAWEGTAAPDFDELTDALLAGEPIVTVARAGQHGLLLDLGGAGFANVYRVGPRELVVIECLDDDQDMSSFCTANGIEPRSLGEIEIQSGMLALLHVLDPGSAPEPVPHVFADVPNGRYRLIAERVPATNYPPLTRVRITGT